jgi:transcriptional regulator with XRE-family HTH domain
MENTTRHLPLPPDLAALLAARRRQLGWSYRQAARRTGIAHGYLCMLEHGQRAPSIIVAVILSRAYGLSAADADRLAAVAVYDHGRDWPGR